MSMEQGRFGMKDRDFFGDPEGGLAGGVRSLMKAGFRGIALDAPHVVSPTERTQCPVLIAHVDLARKLVQSPVSRHCVVIATDLLRHRTYAAPAVVQRTRGDENQPLELPSPTQVSAQSYQVDLRDRLGLPWDRGDLRVHAVSRDQVSNPVAIRLGAADDSYRDPVAEAFIEAEWAKMSPPAIHPPPGVPFPSYVKTLGSPAVPEEPYVSISAPRLVESHAGASVVVHGSFRVRSTSVQTVGPEHRASYDEPVPAGIVTIALILTGSDGAGPEQVNLFVPVFGQPEGGDHVGYFAVDLAAHVSLLARARTWFLYVACDDILVGPLLIAVVTPEQLPSAAER
jgi:hypothetical protein